ncbi:MAG: NAD(P)H-dependent oxidoreductase [Rhodobacteraceae bacterium]|nr:NAD(P)H-dependent oxidoreductase [Paracoccaceae bacterium]
MLKRRELQLLLCVGLPQNGYGPDGYNKFGVAEFLRPLQQTAALCSMGYLPPMWMHSAVAVDDATIARFADGDKSDARAAQRRIEAKASSLT